MREHHNAPGDEGARRHAAARRWDRSNPVARRAHHLIHSAKRRGDLVPMPCEVCGAMKTEAHHDDYSKPFDVRWLCRLHHRQQHARARCDSVLAAEPRNA